MRGSGLWTGDCDLCIFVHHDFCSFDCNVCFQQILDLFMSHTMRLDETDIYGNTPLHLAAQFGNISCINLLTKDYLYGLINYANMERHTPLHVAVIYQQL